MAVMVFEAAAALAALAALIMGRWYFPPALLVTGYVGVALVAGTSLWHVAAKREAAFPLRRPSRAALIVFVLALIVLPYPLLGLQFLLRLPEEAMLLFALAPPALGLLLGTAPKRAIQPTSAAHYWIALTALLLMVWLALQASRELFSEAGSGQFLQSGLFAGVVAGIVATLFPRRRSE